MITEAEFRVEMVKMRQYDGGTHLLVCEGGERKREGERETEEIVLGE